MEYETYNYLIPSWALCSLINGDDSGLDEDDIQALDIFEKQAIENGIGHWSYDTDEEPGFYRSNDIHNLGDNCLHVQYIVFNRES